MDDAISGVRAAIGRAKLQSDPRRAAELLNKAIYQVEEHLTDLVIVIGRNLVDLLQKAKATSQPSSRAAYVGQPRPSVTTRTS